MMGNFPSLNKGAKIFYTRTNENRFSKRKSLKNKQKIVYEIPDFSSFYPNIPFFPVDFTKFR